MEEAIAVAITSAIDDHFANSVYVSVIINVTSNITVEKMLIIYLTIQQKGEPETVHWQLCYTLRHYRMHYSKNQRSTVGLWCSYGSGSCTGKWWSECDGGSKVLSCTTVAAE